MPEVIGSEEHEAEQDDEEHPYAEQVLDRVVGVERQHVLLALGVDAERVVRAEAVQRPQVQDHQADDHEGQQVVQAVEALEGRIANPVAAQDPGEQLVADQRDRREHVGDHGCRPEAHLPPRQHVAHESGGHRRQQDEHAEPPQHLARPPVRAVIETAEEMDVDDGEEGGGPVGVHVAEQPTVIDVAHDVLDAVEGEIGVRRVVHGEDYAGDQLDHQRQPRQGTKVPPVVEVSRGRIDDQRIAHQGKDRQAVVDPLDDPPAEGRLAHGAGSASRCGRCCRRGRRIAGPRG